jgi:hypothetical protein
MKPSETKLMPTKTTTITFFAVSFIWKCIFNLHHRNRVLKQSLAQLKKRLTMQALSLLVALGWGTCVGAITLWAVFQGILLPSIRALPSPEGVLSVNEVVAIYYLGIIGVSTLAGMILSDFARSLGGIIVSYLLGAFIVFESLSAPGLSESTLDALVLITRNSLTLVAIDQTFRIMFPFPLFAILLGGILGTALGEHYF